MFMMPGTPHSASPIPEIDSADDLTGYHRSNIQL